MAMPWRADREALEERSEYFAGLLNSMYLCAVVNGDSANHSKRSNEREKIL